MKAKTTINFNDAQLEALRTLMLNIGWQNPQEGSYGRIEFYRTDEVQQIARDLSDLLDRADTCGITTEGRITR